MTTEPITDYKLDETAFRAACNAYADVLGRYGLNNGAMEKALIAYQSVASLKPAADELEALKHDNHRLAQTNAELLGEIEALRAALLEAVEANSQRPPCWRTAMPKAVVLFPEVASPA